MRIKISSTDLQVEKQENNKTFVMIGYSKGGSGVWDEFQGVYGQLYWIRVVSNYMELSGIFYLILISYNKNIRE